MSYAQQFADGLEELERSRELDVFLGAWVRKGQQGNGGFAVAVV